MKIVAIMNQKGGIGKTMTAASVAYILGEEKGKRVLAVDADQQGNMSMLFERFEPEGIGLPDLLEHHTAAGGTYKAADVIQTTPYSNIDIIPCNGYLMRTNMNLLLNEREDQFLRFASAMIEVSEAYDFCIVDCGLLMDMAVMNVLVAADMVIIPVKVGGFEIEAVTATQEQVEDLRSLNAGIRTKVLMTMRQKNMTSLQVEKWLKRGTNCFRTSIRRSIMAEKATMAHLPLPKFSRSCVVANDYRDMTEELLEEMEVMG